jgi:hypothetical protein
MNAAATQDALTILNAINTGDFPRLAITTKVVQGLPGQGGILVVEAARTGVFNHKSCVAKFEISGLGVPGTFQLKFIRSGMGVAKPRKVTAHRGKILNVVRTYLTAFSAAKDPVIEANAVL